MVFQRLLVNFLLMSTMHWKEVLGQDKISTNSTIDTRVVGGDIVTNEELGGYFMALRYKSRFVCGGTLIQDLIVISAAHCFRKRTQTNWWSVHGGVSALNETGVSRRIKKFITPEEFNIDTMDMDVAVVLLDRPMVGRSIHKLSLCKTPPKVGSSLTVAGFGSVAPGSHVPGNYLHKALVPMVSLILCRKVYRSSIAISDSMLCASALGKRDACAFDSGGPLVYRKQLCGIVSFGAKCASNRYPGVYANVYKVKPFIGKSIKMLLTES